MFLILPTGTVVFVLSLIIGHFLSEPLTILIKKLQVTTQGGKVSYEPDHHLYEADQISELIGDIAKTAESQQENRIREESRQTDLISDVAHELRTPLTAIRGNAELLADPDLPPAMHDKFCSIIVSESERLTRLTNDLLTLQRIKVEPGTPELKRVNLRNLAEEVVNTLSPILIDRGANVAITGEAPDVLGNIDSLKQALTNLVENASRFIDPGGHITIELCGLRDNSVITVKDDGTGFGDIDPNLLFGRFYRADTSRCRTTGGTGLGLSIVKSIVDSHDGTIEALNLPEGGACFIVAIPSITDQNH